ncbi:transcriptional repressor [Streptomyces spinoverrucosus]|uniref:Fur family transcriptional regulator n=1 Tax=Streptomyces spinoverrucosus TaxID=284043 RepID=UPI0018C4401A|nr:Fur family transcriptional regulator [Streptomyces spinoverrucosus]MBG0851340.1 transcriptional repressor [Streptomyces spinoverrucosus]
MSGRITRQRAAVLNALTHCQEFVSAQDLHALLTADGTQIGLTTVYRALRDLEATGGVDVVRDEVGERLYRSRAGDEHRHYLICRSCGRSRPVDSEVIEEWAERITAQTGFAAVEHTVELTGVCTACQPATDERGNPPRPWDSGHTAHRDRPPRAAPPEGDRPLRTRPGRRHRTS